LSSALVALRQCARIISQNRRHARRARQAVSIVSVGYLGAILALGFNEMRQIDWVPYLYVLLISLALYPLSVIFQAVAWALSTGYLKHRAWSFSWNDVQVFAASSLLKRLPGGIWQIAGRVVVYKGQGVQARHPIAASVAEQAIITIAAGILYLAFGPFRGKGVFVDVLVTGALCVLTGVAAGQVVGGLSWLRHSSLGLSARLTGSGVFAAVAVLYLAALGVASAILYMLVRVSGNVLFTVFDAFAVNGLVVLASTALLLLPVGLGIREITLTLVLAPFVGRPVAVVIAVLLRLLYVAGDLVWGLALVAAANRLTVSGPEGGAVDGGMDTIGTDPDSARSCIATPIAPAPPFH
jgi:hypothetical protein